MHECIIIHFRKCLKIFGAPAMLLNLIYIISIYRSGVGGWVDGVVLISKEKDNSYYPINLSSHTSTVSRYVSFGFAFLLYRILQIKCDGKYIFFYLCQLVHRSECFYYFSSQMRNLTSLQYSSLIVQYSFNGCWIFVPF